MKLEVGKKYKTRAGCKAFVFSMEGQEQEAIGYIELPSNKRHVTAEWFSDGTFYMDKREAANDIVAEWIDLPDPGEGWRLLHPDEDVEEGDEYFSDCNGRWMESNNYRTNNCKQTREVTYRRRIAPQYVPYTWDDRDELRGRWLKSKRPPHCEFIVLEFKSMSGTHLRVNGIDAVALLNEYEWLDGTPCGKKVV